MEHIAIGAAKAGKKAEDVEIVNRAMVLCTDDKEYGRNLFRAALGPTPGTTTSLPGMKMPRTDYRRMGG